MSASRFSRLQKATALVPLALLSTAWTASLAGVSPSPTLSAASVDDPGAPVTLPDGSEVPSQAIEAPASVSSPSLDGPVGAGDGLSASDSGQVVSTSSTNGIPSAALAAYQRAETVINEADKTCNVKWQLIAAIGRVESDHGRFGGSALDDDGVAQPSITGIALDGSGATARIRDTDAGQLDGDKKFDRAVGPMQFIPSTWSSVGVDADNDGRRNPQDIDDAALAAAVYLCSGSDDLSTTGGQRAAVYRYNNSQSYVDLVLSIMESYLGGDFTSVPNSTRSAGFLAPVPTLQNPDGPGADGQQQPARPSQQPSQSSPQPAPESDSSGSSSDQRSPDDGGAAPGDGGGNGGPVGDQNPSPAPPKDPVQETEKQVKDTVDKTKDTVKDTVDKTKDTVDKTTDSLTRSEAETQCKERGVSLTNLASCISKLLN